MKYKTNRNLSTFWEDMYEYYYALEKRAMEQSGIKLTPYGREIYGNRTNEFLFEVEDEKKDRLYDILKGHIVFRKPCWR